MKKLLMLSLLLVGMFITTTAQNYYVYDGQCDFYEDYSSTTGWTQVGTEVEIINGQLEFINGAADGYGPGGSANGSQRRVYKDLGTTLNANDTWIAEMEFTPASVGTHIGAYTGHTLLALTAGVKEPFNDCPDLPCSSFPIGSQDGIMLTYLSPTPGDGNLFFEVRTKDNTSEQVSLNIIANSLNITYYIRLERTSATNLKLSIFSDAARTIHIPNSPITESIPNTVEGLNTVQHGNIVRGDYRRELTGAIDNLCINFNQATGIFNSELNEIKFNLYPNPTTGKVRVDLGEVKSNVKAILTNNLGQVILTQQFESTNDINMEIDAPTGIYFLQIETENNETKIIKVLKE